MPEQIFNQRGVVDWLRAVETMLGTGSWVWEKATARLIWSSGLYDMIGVAPASVSPSLSFLESMVHPKDRLPLDDAEGIATDKRHRNRKFRIIRPDGQLRWLKSHMQTTFDRNGDVQYVVTAVSDVTEQEDVKLRLSSREALLDVIANLLGARLWTANHDGRLVDIVDYAGGSEREANSQTHDSWRDTVHPDDRERMAIAWRDNGAKKSRYNFNLRIRMSNGQYQTVYTAGLPFDPALSSEPLWGGISTENPRLLGAVATTSAKEDRYLTPAQVRACRALLGWSAETLASNAGLSVSTIRRLESAATGRTHDDSIRLIVVAMQDAGLSITRGEDGRYTFSGPN